jgi:DNA-binding NarL/FixJ family response regulator
MPEHRSRSPDALVAVEDLAPSTLEPWYRLGREWDVLELMRTGASTQGIAARLYISATTVRSHVTVVLRKLGVADREAAVKLLECSSDRP